MLTCFVSYHFRFARRLGLTAVGSTASRVLKPIGKPKRHSCSDPQGFLFLSGYLCARMKKPNWYHSFDFGAESGGR